jgi:hypothetical protein
MSLCQIGLVVSLLGQRSVEVGVLKFTDARRGVRYISE